MPGRNHVEDLRGASRLAVEATRGVTDLVEAVHRKIASGPGLLKNPLEAPVRVISGLVYQSVRRVTDLVGTGIDLWRPDRQRLAYGLVLHGPARARAPS